MMQIILTIVLFVIVGICCFIFWWKRRNDKPDEIHHVTLTMPYLIERVKRGTIEVTRADEIVVTNAEYKVRRANQERLNTALTQCIDGIKSARTIVIAFYRDLIKADVENEADACQVMDFQSMEYMTSHQKWLILYMILEKRYGDDVVNYLDREYHLTTPRKIMTEIGERDKLEFNAELLDEIFEIEVLSNDSVMADIGYEFELDVLAMSVFAELKGFSVIDVLRHAKIDGFNFGTSGSTRYAIEGRWDDTYRSTNSVWVQINAKWVHFSFIDFGSMEVMRRIVRQLTSYGNLAPMTEKMPIKVTDAPDGSRVTAFGIPAGECWACFVRKFNLSKYSMEFLLKKDYAANHELPMKLLYYLAKARLNLPVTGQQNTGKTTFMKSLIELYDMMNIRVMEMSFELALREIYPWMNIFTAKPTTYVKNAKIQDTFKKSDGELSMVGEVAEDDVVPNMIQFARVASQATMFSSHHKTDSDLIYGLADSWTSVSSIQRDAAISAILDCIKINVHMDFNNHNRVLAFISEIIKESELQEYPAISMPNDVVSAIFQQTYIDREYYTRTTDRVKFTSRQIIVYDEELKAYRANDWFTDATVKVIMDRLPAEDREGFVRLANEEFMEVRKIRKRKDKEAAMRAGKTILANAV